MYAQGSTTSYLEHIKFIPTYALTVVYFQFDLKPKSFDDNSYNI